MAVTGRGMIGTEELGRERFFVILKAGYSEGIWVWFIHGWDAWHGAATGVMGVIFFKLSLMCAWACDPHDAGIPQ